MPFGAGSLCSANSSWWTNGSSTASVICSIWLVEAADVGVGDVGHLFEHELLDLGPGQLLEQQARPRVHQDVVAGPQLLADEHVGQLAHPLLVGPADDQRPRAVLEDLLERDDLAGHLGAAGQHDVQRLVEHDLLAALELVEIDLGAERHPHLAAAREHVDGAVVVATRAACRTPTAAG